VSSPTTFDVGDLPRVACTFTDLAGVPADPGVVHALVRSPVGSIASVAVTRTATGAYYADVDLTSEGTWTVRFVGTYGLQAAAETVLQARGTAFG
jgi:hypothetical protein